jgi:hypothetical protein
MRAREARKLSFFAEKIALFPPRTAVLSTDTYCHTHVSTLQDVMAPDGDVGCGRRRQTSDPELCAAEAIRASEGPRHPARDARVRGVDRLPEATPPVNLPAIVARDPPAARGGWARCSAGPHPHSDRARSRRAVNDVEHIESQSARRGAGARRVRRAAEPSCGPSRRGSCRRPRSSSDRGRRRWPAGWARATRSSWHRQETCEKARTCILSPPVRNRREVHPGTVSRI